MFRIKSLAESEGHPTATANPATTATESAASRGSRAATTATTATDVAKVAAVAVAAGSPDGIVREARQAKVEAQLRAHPELNRAFDVAEAPLAGSPGEPVSVVIAVRHGDQILSGEVHIPRERWDLAAFLAVMDSPEGQQ